MQLKSGNEFVISEQIREEIARNNGVLCTPGNILRQYGGARIIAVGDVTTAELHKAGIRPFIEIVDLKTKRGTEGEFPSVPGSHRIKSDPATLSHDLFLLIQSLMNGNGGRIEIDGEEDLAVIPIIFYSDLNTVVTYGIPDVGMACIPVNLEVKNLVTQMIERMEVRCQN
ncbi:MAG: DUF359 domain-containing protein [Candidatus Thermoplasmatota archaeon]|nr:DUF359 domain-containing protein [Candidatus Thermoplasmatota archaeon]